MLTKKIVIKIIVVLVGFVFFTLFIYNNYHDKKNIVVTDQLIPRKIFFGNPEKTKPLLSPDGKKIAFLAPVKGVLNIWVANINNPYHAKSITKVKRDIINYFWSFNNNYILYTQDADGDENFHLYRLNLRTGETDDLTVFPEARIDKVWLSPQCKNKILVGVNTPASEWYSVYRIDIVSGNSLFLEKNNSFEDFVVDRDLKLRIASKPTSDGGTEYYIKDSKEKWRLYERISIEDSMSTFFIGFNKTGNVAYKMDSQNRDKTAIYAVDLFTNKKTMLAESNKADCKNLLLHPTKHTPQAFNCEYAKVEWGLLDKDIESDFVYLKNHYSGNFNILNRSLADDKWLISYYSDVESNHFYLYKRDPINNKPISLTFLFAELPLLDNYLLRPMRFIKIKTRDGLDLICYLTLPCQEAGQRVSNKLLPTVLLVHGGPWWRDSWGLNLDHQWLANRGYAVLSVNFRGSTGFGKMFTNAGNKEWGGKMHDDLIDAVNYMIKPIFF